MTSPKKSLDGEKDSTLFGDLANIEVENKSIQKQTARMSNLLIDNI